MSNDSPFTRNRDIGHLSWVPLFRLEVEVDYENAVHVRDSPDGGRSLFPITGGSFTGDHIRGEVLPGGCDWIHWRSKSDGAWMIDVRLMMRADDGETIAMEYRGISWADASTMERFLRRDPLDFHEVYGRTAVRFQTDADGNYGWLNNTIAVANGMRRPGTGPLYHVFAIT
jgi:hypothetical protein